MDFFQALLLGVIQGVTEFIPVSSSAHLVLVPWALGWPSPSLAFDTMVHWGTLAALLSVFWRDWLRIVRAFVRSLMLRSPWNAEPGGRLAHPDSRLAWLIIIGSLPAALLGYAFRGFFESLFASPMATGAFLLVTALILALSEKLGHGERDLAHLGLRDALVVGAAQAAGIAPGISRSGATIGAGFLSGLTREAAARYSFLLATPAIFGAGVLQLLDLLQAGRLPQQAATLLVGFLAAGVTGYLCIRFLLSYLQHGKLYIFAIYCAVVGALVLIAGALA